MNKDWRAHIDSMEMKPSAGLWEKIEFELDKEQIHRLKRKKSIYKWMAVAATFLLLLSASANIINFVNNQRKVDEITTNTVSNQQLGTSTIPQQENLSDIVLSATDNNEERTENGQSNSEIPKILTVSGDDNGSSNEDITTLAEWSELAPLASMLLTNDDNKSENTSTPQIAFKKKDYIVIPKTKSSSFEGLFAGAEFGSNRTNMQYDFAPQAENVFAEAPRLSPPASRGEPDSKVRQIDPSVDGGYVPEIAISGGAFVGFSLTERINFRTGVQLAVIQSSTYSNTLMYNFDDNTNYPAHVSTANHAINQESYVFITDEYKISNRLHIISIPILLGFNAIESNRINIGIIGGISTDFLIKNEISSSAINTSPLVSEMGENSNFNPVMVSGVAGMEFEYRIAKNYSALVMPTFRTALSSLTRETSSMSANPSGINLGFGLKYNF